MREQRGAVGHRSIEVEVAAVGRFVRVHPVGGKEGRRAVRLGLKQGGGGEGTCVPRWMGPGGTLQPKTSVQRGCCSQ